MDRSEFEDKVNGDSVRSILLALNIGGWVLALIFGAAVAIRPACSQEHVTGDKVLLRAVLQEAESEPYEGMVAVAGVALDRAEDPRWPSTAEAVVRQQYQFEGMSAPKRDYAERAVTSARIAVKAAKGGYRPCGPVLWFHHIQVVPEWDWSKVTPACLIGEHVFYRDRE